MAYILYGYVMIIWLLFAGLLGAANDGHSSSAAWSKLWPFAFKRSLLVFVGLQEYDSSKQNIGMKYKRRERWSKYLYNNIIKQIGVFFKILLHSIIFEATEPRQPHLAFCATSAPVLQQAVVATAQMGVRHLRTQSHRSTPNGEDPNPQRLPWLSKDSKVISFVERLCNGLPHLRMLVSPGFEVIPLDATNLDRGSFMLPSFFGDAWLKKKQNPPRSSSQGQISSC